MKKTLLFVIMVILLIMTACSPAVNTTNSESTEAEEEAAAAENNTEEEADNAEEESAESEAESSETEEEAVDSKVGGTLVIGLLSEPPILDPVFAFGGIILDQIGASLVYTDPDTGELVPYLAESWEESEDGLYWDFHLREDILFHNGTPCTANDFVYTIIRGKDPEAVSPTLAAILQYVTSAEALDDYTLRIHLQMPSPVFLFSIANPPYLQPLSEAYMEAVGQDVFGRNPIGVGPFMFKEWVTGDHITLERNPDFVWGPSFSHEGPAYIETIEYRIIPEYSTILAGIEAGEIDMTYAVESKDVERLEQIGMNFVQTLGQGAYNSIIFNVSKPPFDNVLLRKAISMAVDRQVMIDVLENGQGEVMYGPITSSVLGYWPGVEEIGYTFDLEHAKALMVEAGYTLNADGYQEKDGEVLTIPLHSFPANVQMTTVLQEQLKDLGIVTEIIQEEPNVLHNKLTTGDYSMLIGGQGWDEGIGLMFAMFHSSMIGTLNQSQVSDPQLDELLLTAYISPSLEDAHQVLAEAQRYAIEQAITAPLFTPYLNIALAPNVMDFYKTSNWACFFDAYLVNE